MKSNFEEYYCIYWVFTQLCNDHCDHCYNSSGPQGTRISEADCMAIIGNLPTGLKQIILSGGEPLADKKLLYAILDELARKYDNKLFITLQFNGDLLNTKVLQTLIEKGVDRYSIASIDRYHKKQGARKEELSELFKSKGIEFVEDQPKITTEAKENDILSRPLSYGFFGATEDMWLGGNWARGRALEKDLWKKDGTHNFCAIHSGARGFLGHESKDVMQELSIQLWKINPCCPGTKVPMGDARKEKVSEVLQRMSKHEVMQKLNQGDIYGVGESIGISAKEGLERAIATGNVCLWCDEFFGNCYDMKKQKVKESKVYTRKLNI